jgi:hypothetical protein
MKRSYFKIILFLSAWIFLVNIFSSEYAKAQEQNRLGDEVARLTADHSAPGMDVAVPSSPSVLWQWFDAAGAVFIPYTDTITWGYGGNGCLAPTTAGYWRASVNIPDGSVIKNMSFSYYNVPGSTISTAYLYSYQTTGSYIALQQLISTPGSTEVGLHSVSGSIPDYTIDNQNNVYVFAWSGSTTQQLCSMQVGYTPPPEASTTTTIPACIDNDNDGYGDNCTAGPDCNDNDTFYNEICPDCTVKVIPNALGLFLGEKDKTRRLIILGQNGTGFDENTAARWETSDISVLSKHIFSPQFMFMKVSIDGAALDKGDYRVLIGNCSGKLTLVK